MKKQRIIDPIERAARNASFNILGYIEQKFKEAIIKQRITMDYEKKYKEAFERASNLRKDAVEMENNMTTKTCEIIFPELVESEDEKIRKGIYNFLYNELHNIKQLTPYTDEFDRWLAWVEKQGEKKQWKPTEMQLECLKDACNEHFDLDGLHPLYTLYQQLKAL